MKRRDFYKEYYKVTDRVYADYMILTSGDVRTAWDKGWVKTSKTERKIMIILQYLVLLGTIICFPAGKGRYGFIGCVWFLLSVRITDFSFTKMEIFYRLFRRNTCYATLLYHAFLGKQDSFWQLILPETKKTVSGFVRCNSLRLIAVYRVVLRRSRERVRLIVTPNRVKLRTKSHQVVFDDPTMSREALARAIAGALNTLPCESGQQAPAAKKTTMKSKCKRK